MKKLFSIALLLSVLPGTINASKATDTNLLEFLDEDEDAITAAQEKAAVAKAQATMLEEKARQAKERKTQLATKVGELETARLVAVELQETTAKTLLALQEKTKQADESQLAWFKEQRTHRETQIADFTRARQNSITTLDEKITVLEAALGIKKTTPVVQEGDWQARSTKVKKGRGPSDSVQA